MSDKEDIKILSIESIPIIRKYIDASDQQIAREIDERMKEYVSDQIEVIGAGISVFTSTVFTRKNEKPNKPTGGSYDNPLPNESIWSDGIPDGHEILWASTRVFASDNGKMQQIEWSEPSKMTDTADFEALYSSIELPKIPTSGFNKDQYGIIDQEWLADNPNWHDEPGSDEIWMATNTAKNGVWGSTWAISKIKGEDGLDGKDGDNIEFIYYLTNEEVAPSTPEPLTNLEELEGWTDNPTGVSETQRFEYFSMRKKLGTDQFFGNWSTPALWSKYGENGKDGDGLEYIYKTTETNYEPKLTIPEQWQNDELYQTEEYIPEGWTDDPSGVDEINLYEWVSSRKYNGTTKKWGTFSIPKIWAKYGENGKDGKDGEQGPQGPQGNDGTPGKLGKVVYPAGEFDETKVYTSTETQTPYVIDTDGKYYVLKSEKTTTRQHPKDNETDWEQFASFEAIYAKIAMIDNGTIGSAVYSGDYMFSQQGINSRGYTSNDFQYFNPEHIYDNESTFKPNICMDFKNGQIWASAGNFNIDNKGNINMNGDITLDGNISLSGDIFLTGFLKKNTTIINTSNYSKYITTENGCTYLDIKKTGTLIQIESLPDDGININLPYNKMPYLNKSGQIIIDKTGTELMRQLFGTEIMIINDTKKALIIWARGALNGGTDPSGFEELSAGCIGNYKLIFQEYSINEKNIETYCWHDTMTKPTISAGNMTNNTNIDSIQLPSKPGTSS